jgi:LytS/YehU family sensor histidine kinase
MTGIFIALGFLFHNLYKATREKAEKLEAKNTEAELHAFKNQMQPHFLFNSLNSLMALIETNSDQAPVMTQRLADLYREILNNSTRHLATLQSEVAIIERYLSLERFRFGSRLDYAIATPGGTDSIYLPPLILQTLVENSIKHGISNEVEGGKISVDISPEDGGYRAAIRNPGRIQPAATASGVGLKNSKARLDLLYGEKHGLKIEETQGSVQTSFWFSGENRT